MTRIPPEDQEDAQDIAPPLTAQEVRELRQSQPLLSVWRVVVAQCFVGLLVFVVGGVTRGEMRAVAEASRRTGRDVLLGSSGVLRPGSFLSLLRSMGTAVPA